MDQAMPTQGGNGMWGGGNAGRGPNVRFYTRSVLNKARTRETGSPVHEGVAFVLIRHPGEVDALDRPASEEDKARFPQQWAAYSQNVSYVPEGTPLEILFPLHPEVAANLRGKGVHTVEQLAALSGDALGKVGMGAQGMQVKAQKFLEHAGKGVEFQQMQAALGQRDDKIAALEESLKMAQAQINRLIASQQGAMAMPQQLPPIVNTAAAPAYVASPATRPEYEFIGGADIEQPPTEQPKRPRGRPPKSTGL